MGSTSFSVLATPGTPLVIAAGEHVDFTVKYDPQPRRAPETATIRIVSNDPDAPVVDLLTTGLRGTARLATAIADSGNLGNVCLGRFVDRELTINNSGTCPLRVQSITSSSPEFLVPAVVSYPLDGQVGNSIALPIRFQPTSFGAEGCQHHDRQQRPGESPDQWPSPASRRAPELDLIVANSRQLRRRLHRLVRGLTADAAEQRPLHPDGDEPSPRPPREFLMPNVLAYPIRIAPGTAVAVPIRFEPASFGPKSATITVTSDDPTGAKSVAVSGYRALRQARRHRLDLHRRREGMAASASAPSRSATSATASST